MSGGIRTLLYGYHTQIHKFSELFIIPEAQLGTMKVLSIFFIFLFMVFIHPAAARVEITSVYSDENSMDITLRSPDSIHDGIIVFSLTYDNEILESKTMELNMTRGEETTRMVTWGKYFRFGVYTANARVFNNGELVGEASRSYTYGSEALPRFQIVDLSASSSGTSLLLKPRSASQPGVADFTFQLIRAGEILYAETKEDIPVIQTTQIAITWPVLLEDHTAYTVRVKAFSHTPHTVTTYTHEFSSGQDVEIDETDVEVDDFGISVTLIGKSQVPFEGTVDVELRQDAILLKVFSGRPEILTLNRDDTVGIIWDDLEPGTYEIFILVRTLDGEILDRYETVLSIPERLNPIGQTVRPQSPGFTAVIGIAGIIVMSLILRKK